MAYEIQVCDACGKPNRVSSEKLALGLQPKCGECGKLLMIPENGGPVIITDGTFESIVEKASSPVLVDFWAPWCGPCLSLAPVIDQIASEFSGKIRVGKLNTDENPSVSYRFQVRSIPTLILFQNGMEVDRLIGVQPKSEIAARLRKVLKAS